MGQEMETEFVDVYSTLTEKLINWLETTVEMLPNLVMALLVLLLFFVIGRFVRKAAKRMLAKATDNKTIINLLETVVGVIVVTIGLFIALGILDLDGTVTSLLAGAGVIGLALGFAFQNIASNFIAGVILSIRHPFGIGDIVETNDFYGTVQNMNLRNTIIRTPQGQTVFIPNKSVFENPLENFTISGERRIDLECSVSYGDDLEKAKEVAIEAVETLDNYDDDKEVEFYYEEFGGSSINFEIRFWVNFKSNSDFLSARSDAIIAIMKAFEETDIMIPFPIRTLDFGVRGGEKLDAMIGEGRKSQNS